MYDKYYLEHFGTKGMKWGTRKAKDLINNKSRTIRQGTTIQNITSKAYEDKGRHMYAAYTPYDKTFYGDMMANFMYNGKGFKNEFVVKKDIKVPSDKHLVDTFTKMVKANPQQVSKDMSMAYNTLHVFSKKSEKYYSKKFSSISEKNIKLGEKLTKDYIQLLGTDKMKKSRSIFFGNLIKQGFDAISDVNDRDSMHGSQDPLIIINPKKSLGKVKSVKLTNKDLDNYFNLTFDDKFTKSRKDLSKIQR